MKAMLENRMKIVVATRTSKAGAAVLLAMLGACSGVMRDRLPIPIERESARAWLEFTDPQAFRWNTGEGDGIASLDLFAPSTYQPPHRSPLAMAIVHGSPVENFVLRVKAKQTGREYPHRDLVIVFGYVDPSHFAYAHLASAADPNAHHLMLVDGADRRPVTSSRSNGVVWGDAWHDIEVRRTGTHVEVLFDGAGPVLVGEVPGGPGTVGVGSFDDTGRFRELVIEPR